MDTTTATAAAPAATEPEIDMMKVAMEADAALDNPANTTPAPAKPEQTPATGAQDGKQDNQPDPAKPDDKTAAKPEDKKEGDDDKGTAYEKSKKDAERRDRSWKALEQEKTEFRAEKARIEADLNSLRQEVARLRQAPASQGPAKDKHGMSASDYEKLAKRYETEGNDEMAQAAKERAEALRQQPAATPADPFQTPDFQAAWQGNVQALVREDPTLADPKNPIVQAANALTQHPQYGKLLRSDPAGIRAAVEIARLQANAHAAHTFKAELDQTKSQLTKAQAEVERLTKLLQPRGSLPGGPAPSSNKSGAEMNSDEIRAIAAAADRGEI